jgi:hypothetical protein
MKQIIHVGDPSFMKTPMWTKTSKHESVLNQTRKCGDIMVMGHVTSNVPCVCRWKHKPGNGAVLIFTCNKNNEV